MGGQADLGEETFDLSQALLHLGAVERGEVVKGDREEGLHRWSGRVVSSCGLVGFDVGVGVGVVVDKNVMLRYDLEGLSVKDVLVG